MLKARLTVTVLTRVDKVELDPSAAADCRIRCRKFVRQKSAEKIMACRISRWILL